jgi:hypothetical protein
VDEAEEATQAGDTPKKAKSAGPTVPRADLSEKDKARMAMIDLRCLNLCIGMLERVNGVRCIRAFYSVALTYGGRRRSKTTRR